MMTTRRIRHNRSGRGKIRLLLLLVAALLIGAGVSWGILGRQTADAAGKHSKSRKDARERAKQKPKEDLVFIDMGSFLVNLVSPGELHYLQVTVTIGFTGIEKPESKGGHGEAAAEPELPPAADAQIRDTIVEVLSQQSFDAVRTDASRAKLKTQLQKRLARLPIKCKARQVLFTSFLMQ